MTTTLAMICVESVSATAEQLCGLFDWRSTHGGEEFDELADQDGERAIWLHHIEAPEHPRFARNKPGILGRGLATYVFVDEIEEVYRRAAEKPLTIVEPLAKNSNAGFREFSFIESNGYCFSVAERLTSRHCFAKAGDRISASSRDSNEPQENP